MNSSARSAFLPSHSLLGDPQAARLGFVLHGALGSSQNFRRFARQLTEAIPELSLAIVDLRGHGESHGAPAPHTLESCAEDLGSLAQHLGRPPEVVIGHSFGGKVALEYARLFEADQVGSTQAGSLAQVWALDSDPGAQEVTPSHEVLRVMQAVRSVPLPIPDRQHVVQSLRAQGFSSGIANWMTTNIKRQGKSYGWTLDLDVIEALMRDYFARDLWPYLGRTREALDIHLLVAEQSDRWDPSKRARAEALPKASRCQVHVLPNSGHWVHVDNPEGLLELMASQLAAPQLPAP